MSEPQTNMAVDGQEFAVGDLNALGTTAGLADDRALAEFLRLPLFDGTSTYKTILPYSQGVLTPGASIVLPGTVQPTGSPNGSINVMPFRAVVGSRVAAASNPLANWRDIRSSVFVGQAALAQAIAISPNASGNARWDLVYASVTIDLPSGGQVRRIKNPSAGNISSTTLTTFLANPVTVTVLTGTPGATPTIPSLPADSGGVYNIAIAAVRVVNGFTSTHTVLTADIRDQVAVSPGQSPTMGTTRTRPASGNNDQSATYATHFPWTTSAGTRPAPFLPPSMVGVEGLLVEVDDAGGSPSHSNGSIVDASIDWRNRFFISFAANNEVGIAADFANNPAHGGAVFPLPLATTAVAGPVTRMAQSFVADASLVAGAATVIVLNSNVMTGIAGGATAGIYVDPTSGALKWFSNGTPTGCRFFLWVMSCGQFPNA